MKPFAAKVVLLEVPIYGTPKQQGILIPKKNPAHFTTGGIGLRKSLDCYR